MAESKVKLPHDPNWDMDFLAFSFNGKHSWDDFGIYRTISDRYDEGLSPTLADKTAEVPGGDGMYYFGTTHKQRNFNVNFAFDNMSEEKFREMKQWLNGKEMGDLWFSECPYKVWTAKVTGQSSMKYIPFDINSKRIYKGEGTITFTAYWPYAHTPDYVAPAGEIITEEKEHGLWGGSIKYWVDNKRVFKAGRKYTLIFQKLDGNGNGLTVFTYKAGEIAGSENGTTTYSWNVDAPGSEIISFTPTQDFYMGFASRWAVDAQIIPERTIKYKYSLYEGDATSIATHGDGKDLNSWLPLGTYEEWKTSSGMRVFSAGENPCRSENFGDLPAHFTMDWPGLLDSKTTFIIGDAEITIEGGKYSDIHWDSKTGLVTALMPNSNYPTTRTAILVTGQTLGTIPVDNMSPFVLKNSDGSEYLRTHLYKWEERLPKTDGSGGYEWREPEAGTIIPTIKYHYWYY